MYKCYECGRTFDHPKMIKELRDTVSLCGITQGYYETMAYCPHCDGEGFAEINEKEKEIGK